MSTEGMFALNRTTTIALLGFSFILLCFLLIFPPHYDQYIFYTGGEKIFQGAIPYRDVIDTKPGLIFYIYGFSTWLFGHSGYAARWLDFFFHIATLAYFYLILRREYNRRDIAGLSIFVYVAFYIAGGPFSTGQSESYALLPNLAILDLTNRILNSPGSRVRALRYGVLAGLAGAVLVLLKYTLGFFLIVPVVLAFFSRKDKPYVLTYIGTLVFTALLILGAWIAYLVVNGAWPNVVENFKWLSAYSGMDPFGDLGTINDKILSMFVKHTTLTFSLSFLALGCIGIYKSIAQGHEPRQHQFFQLYLLLQFLIAMTSMLLERKFLFYQFTRAFWCVTPFIAIGILALLTTLAESTARKTWKALFVAAGIVLLMLYSPLSSIMGIATKATSAPVVTFESARMALLDQKIANKYEYVAQELRPQLAPEDQVFVFGHHTGLYFHLDRVAPTFISASGFIIAAWAPDAWKQQMLRELYAANPKFILVEFNDPVPLVSGSLFETWYHFLRWDELRDWVYRGYEEVMPINRYRIFKRKS